ncbi:MAG: ATP-binding cassette domain-containing protein [Acidimicrobiaceae bacterium]|nr:ATP-binding cassette domain-containing protein [Acidimicrobiaceae bacterium]
MDLYLPFVVAGLVTGSVYALAGLGLVLTYKTSGVFNFAHGALATIAAYAFYELHVQNGLAWPVAAAIVVLVIGPVLGLVLEVVARRLAARPLAHQVAATVGLLLVVAGGVQLYYGTTEVRTVPPFLPADTFELAGTAVRWSDLIIFAFTIATAAGLAVYFKVARSGLQMRAVVDSPELLSLFGTGPATVRRQAWVLGSVLVSASGVLLSPILPLDPIQLTLLVVAAFGAAALGAFSSLGGTVVGGFAIGVAASLCTKWFTTGLLAGLPVALPFLVLFVVLVVFPKRRLVTRPATAPLRSALPVRVAGRVQVIALVVVIAFLALVPSFAGVRLTSWTLMAAGTVVFLSLSLLARTSGQVSLAHMTFVAIGSTAFAHLSDGHGLPWLVALFLASLVAVPVGALLAIPAIRLGGLYLALATFGFGIMVQGMFYTEDYMFGGSGNPLPEPRPGWLGTETDAGFYRLVLVFVLVTVAVVVGLNRTRLGRLMRGIAQSPTAVATMGAQADVTRVLTFCISAYLASFGGALLAVAESSVTGTAYQPLTSLLWFAVMVVVGGGVWGAALAAVALYVLPAYISSPNVSPLQLLVFGALALAVATRPSLPVSAGLRGLLTGGLSRLSRPPGAARVAAVTPGRVEAGELVVDRLEVRFGGVVAVDGVSFTAPTGHITGLIGPNGAGKSTTFNACSGLLRPTSGAVSLHGHDVTHRSPAYRARRGLGRTFQRMELMEEMSVLDNIAFGAEGPRAGYNVLAHVFSAPATRRNALGRAHHAAEVCGLGDLVSRPVGSLSTGQRRLVELARCLAGDFRILLLDEPSSGLDHRETKRFGQILRAIVAERGVGILLVEHDMPLVMEICDQIHVLDFGKPIFSGAPSEVMASPIVRRAYLGDEPGGDPGAGPGTDPGTLQEATA